MSSHEWDPSLEATAELFASRLEGFSRESVLLTPQLREAIAEISERDSRLPADGRARSRRFARQKFRKWLDARLEKIRVEAVQLADELLRPVACLLVDERVRLKLAERITELLFPDPPEWIFSAHRAAEIMCLGKRHAIDQERVATWIREGRSVEAVSQAILKQIAQRNERPQLYRTGLPGARHAPEPIPIEASPIDGEIAEESGPGSLAAEPSSLTQQLAEVYRLSLACGLDPCRVADVVDQYWTPAENSQVFVAAIANECSFKPREIKTSVIGELFASLEFPEREAIWKVQLKQWLTARFARISNEQRSASKASVPDVPEEAAGDYDDRPESPGLKKLFPNDPRKQFFAKILLDHPDMKFKQQCENADIRRRQRPAERAKLAPRKEWMTAIRETRLEKYWQRDDDLWVRVSELHAVEVWASEIRTKLKRTS
jgi:hypothetical protein